MPFSRVLALAALACATGLTTTTAAAATSVGFLAASSTSTNAASSAVTADFTLDGVPDVAYVRGSVVAVESGVRGAAGSFSNYRAYSLGGFTITALTTGDVNGDGYVDLVASLYGTSQPATAYVAAYYGTSSGLPSTYSVAYRLDGYRISDLATADLDAGGRAHLILTGRRSAASTPTSDVIAAFDLQTAKILWFGSSETTGPMPLVVDDFDRDGNVDAAFGAGENLNLYYGTGQGIVLKNGRNEPWDPARLYTVANAGRSTDLASGDLDGDGRPDLVARSGGKLGVWRSPVSGVAPATTTTAVPAASGSLLALADLDHDDTTDVLIDDSAGALRFLAGSGNGSLGPEQQVAQPTAAGAMTSFVLRDVSYEGSSDLFATNGRAVTRYEGITPQAPARSALISEVRFSGPKGAADQYVQIFNPGTRPLGLGGWSLRLSNGRSVSIPRGTVVPAAGHLLVTTPSEQATGYGLAASTKSTFGLPFGLTPSAGAVAMSSTRGGVALVDNNGLTRDAVGLAGAPNGYFAGTALAPFTAVGQSGYVRRFEAGVPVNTRSNADDFIAVDTQATGTGGTILGAPRPDSLVSPTMKNDFLQSSLVDRAKTSSQAPNRVVTAATADAPATLTINRTITNCSGAAKTATATAAACANAATIDGVTVTKLRFRITALSTRGNTTTGGAVLKSVTSADATTGGVAVNGIPLDAPSESTGGGLNSSLTATKLIAAGLAPGASVNVAFTFLVENPGAYTFGFNTEDDLVDGDTAPTSSPAVGSISVTSPNGASVEAVKLVDEPSTEAALPAPSQVPSAPAATPAAPGPVVVAETPAAQAPQADAATETVHGVIPASAVTPPTAGVVSKPAPSTTKAAPTKSKKATCKVTKTKSKSKSKAKSKKSTKPCTTKKTTKAKAKSPKKTKAGQGRLG